MDDEVDSRGDAPLAGGWWAVVYVCCGDLEWMASHCSEITMRPLQVHQPRPSTQAKCGVWNVGDGFARLQVGPK